MRCPPGSYSLSSNFENKWRRVCPDGSESCEGGVISLKAGWWRRHNLTSSIYMCPYGSNACQGGESTGDDSCGEGYTGPGCAMCQDGYYLQSHDNTCQRCSDSTINVFALVLIAFSIFAVVLVLIEFV